jgi:hypothetical protein
LIIFVRKKSAVKLRILPIIGRKGNIGGYTICMEAISLCISTLISVQT